MDTETAWVQCLRRIDKGDITAAAALLEAYPEIKDSPPWCSILLKSAAEADSPEALAMLVSHGLDINFTVSTGLSSRPLWHAATRNHLAALRWLLANGAKVNYLCLSGNKPPSCPEVAGAILGGHQEAVRLLVEAGAVLDVPDNTERTPLDWALGYGYPAIVDYLHSKGALTARELPTWREPPPRHPIVEAVEQSIPCDSHPLAWVPLIPDEVPVAVHAVFDAEFYGLFTSGMSQQPMTVPLGGEAYRYAELVLHLGEDWGSKPNEWRVPERTWAINWLRQIAQIPFANNTWLGGKWTIISNEDPPQPLSEFTDMTCWLLLGDKEPLSRVELPDGRSVCFYTLMPIHTAERDLALTEGLVALLEKFADQDVPLWLDPHRKSVV